MTDSLLLTSPSAYVDAAGAPVTDLPRYQPDRLMSDGSVFLFDPGHSRGLVSGLPADGAVVPNIAWERAAAILGTGDATTLAGKIMRSASNAACLVERTSKLGFHGLPSRVSGVNALAGFLVSPAEALQNYIHAQTDDDWYFSGWWRVSRPQVAGASSASSMLHKAENTTNYHLYMDGGAVKPIAGNAARLGALLDPTTNTELTAAGTPFFRSLGVTAFTATKNAMNGTGGYGNGVGNGTRGLHWLAGMGDAWASLNVNKAAGMIFYRAYAENLTVSGRTYAAVEALDHTMFQEAFATGGRFDADVYTDPATFP